MTTFLIRRLINLIPTFFLATFLAWGIVEFAPGDFATQFEFDQVDPDKAARIRSQLGLDQPWYVRYLKWLQNLLFHGSFGTSMTSKGEVMDLVWPRMINSLKLVLPATVLIYLISIPIGVYSAIRKYSLGDRLLTVFSLIGLAIPNFFLGLLVLAFAVKWQQNTGCFLIPTGGISSADLANTGACGWGDADLSGVWWGGLADYGWHLLAPMLVVALSSLAGLTRIMRGQMLEVLGQDYIRTARAKGLAPRIVEYKHALRNAILVIVATIGSVIPEVLLGGGTVEFVLRWPGLTPLVIRSVFAQDVYVIMAVLTITVILVMIGNVISDIALALIDPRVKY